MSDESGPTTSNDAGDVEGAFIRAACVPLDDWHGAGNLDAANAILTAHPELATVSIHTAAILGDAAAVVRFVGEAPARAVDKGGPHGWDPLTHLCFSRYLRLDRARSAGFVAAAQALLDAGASANTGFFTVDHQPNPEFESVIYGAAGVARHPGVTRLLLERGADPNDGETPYHTPETVDDRAMYVVVESGKLDEEGITTMLHRKLDWHHPEGVAWLLAHGADPNRPNHPWRCSSALHHALDRCNGLGTFELLMDHGADPTRPALYGESAPSLAARRGRADVLDLFQRRGFNYALDGDARFLESCARGDDQGACAVVAAEPGLVARLAAEDGGLLAEFAGAGNTAGVELLLDLGFSIESRTSGGGASGDTALLVATWRERPATVKLLIDRGAALDAKNRRGATALDLALRAQSEQSDWTPHSSSAVLDLLRAAGAPRGA